MDKKKDSIIFSIFIILNLIICIPNLYIYLNINRTQYHDMGVNKFAFICLTSILFIWIIFLILECNSKYLFYAVLYAMILMLASLNMYSNTITIKTTPFTFLNRITKFLKGFLFLPIGILYMNLPDIYSFGKVQFFIAAFISVLFLFSFCGWMLRVKNQKRYPIIFLLILSNYISLVFTFVYSTHPVSTKEAAIISCINFIIWIIAILSSHRNKSFLMAYEIVFIYLTFFDVIIWINKFIYYQGQNYEFNQPFLDFIFVEMYHLYIFPVFYDNYKYEIIPVLILFSLNSILILLSIYGAGSKNRRHYENQDSF